MLPGCLAPLTATYPPPMLTPAVDFADGVSEVPDGQALFVEYFNFTSFGEKCPPAAIAEPWEGYYFTDRYGQSSRVLRTDGHLEAPHVMPSANGSRVLVGTGNNYWNKLSAVDSLPYVLSDNGRIYVGGPSADQIGLRCVTKQGALVVEINGKSAWINPGQSWSKTEVHRDGYCWITYTSTLINHGLLLDQQIHLKQR